MLVLTRKPQQEIQIGDHIRLKVLRVRGNQVRIGIEAPDGVHIIRGELTPGGKVELVEQTEEDNCLSQKEAACYPAQRSCVPKRSALISSRLPGQRTGRTTTACSEDASRRLSSAGFGGRMSTLSGSTSLQLLVGKQRARRSTDPLAGSSG